MKRLHFLGLLMLVVMALPRLPAAGAEMKISENTKVDLGLSLQTLARLTDFSNPNSKSVLSHYQTEIYMRNLKALLAIASETWHC